MESALRYLKGYKGLSGGTIPIIHLVGELSSKKVPCIKKKIKKRLDKMATDAIIVGICYFQGKMAHHFMYYNRALYLK